MTTTSTAPVLCPLPNKKPADSTPPPNPNRLPNRIPPALTTQSALASALLAAAAFHLAWLFPPLASLTLLYAFFLIRIAAHPSARVAFRLGCLNGLLVLAPHLAWFWNIFGLASICLWSILAFFTGAFVFLLGSARLRRAVCGVPPQTVARPTRPTLLAVAVAVAPILWTGLEYFRSEVYFLKFSWLSLGYAFSENSGLLPTGLLGVYGTSFLIFLLAAITSSAKSQRWLLPLTLLALTLAVNSQPWSSAFTRPSPRPPETTFPTPNPNLNNLSPRSSPLGLPSDFGPRISDFTLLPIAGIQLEFPPALEIPRHLDRLIAEHPQAQLLVLSEYTFDSTIPQSVRDWCRRNHRYLIAGGKDDSVPGNYYNTAFVVGPTGEIIFQQAKSVPIQFFKDGLPAPSQQVWNSPWGKIAIPVCYDLSYRRVMDRFIQAGAQAIIVPFMDVTDWGAQQHELHARIAPLRAREYRIPIFRIGSSGISQNIDPTGRVLAALPFPGQEQTLAATLQIPKSARLPLDHWLAPACSILSASFLFLLCAKRPWRSSGFENDPEENSPPG